MTHDEIINAFVEYEQGFRRTIEPVSRHTLVDDHLRRSLDAYKPAVVVKVGVGAGDLLLTIAEKAETCVCVESSLKVINDFLTKNANNPLIKKIHMVNGNYFSFPIDYFKADMLVCIDYFDFILSAAAMDEFKRATQFEGLFFFAGVVLSDEDIEGVYDECIKAINPLHNDYYLAGDFRTYMHLKDFTTLSDGVETYRMNLKETAEYWQNVPFLEEKIDVNQALAFIDENRELLTSLYKLDAEYAINELYLTGLYRKNKYQEPEATL
jgi:ubiquinone/menaquinone biosynthesis C-methylase UbiE